MKRFAGAVRWKGGKEHTAATMRLAFATSVPGHAQSGATAPLGRGMLAADDRELVGRARAGDQVAFATLFEQYHAPILNYLHRMVGDRALAEDLAQDSFIKAYNALPSTRDDLAFKAWLYRIATNTAISHLRRRKIVQWIPFLGGDQDLHASPGSVEGTVTRQHDVEQALAKLPKHYAAVLLLRHYQGLSLAETAAALDITENAAKLRLFRARKAFAEVYRDADADAAPVAFGAEVDR
ncbi:MAG: RNA polymerase ECF-type sigma factor [uncultured Thermomicrobiales bacterium]|uniref:RNA polymerase sigma factor n=1 Tax=uncultured Thermomicrobiales bacterium TaxID=1645740 RepID=A0A6J4U537_9BACT|nr:MAG: RNA polymerase ECF-type sigma factor [uncultured Thermomicrobiales bacterium]